MADCRQIIINVSLSLIGERLRFWGLDMYGYNYDILSLTVNQNTNRILHKVYARYDFQLRNYGQICN